MIQIGDKIRRRIKIYDPSADKGKPRETTIETEVVYIHPQRRYYTIRCQMPGGRYFHETMYFFPRCGS